MTVRPAWVALLPLAIALGLGGEALLRRGPDDGLGPVWRHLASLIRGPALQGHQGARPEPPSPPSQSADRQSPSQAGPKASADDAARDGSELPTAQPFTWAATRTENGLLFTGHVPSEASRAAMLSAARGIAASDPVEERMQAAHGLDAKIDFAVLTEFALKQLQEMRAGTVTLTGTRLDLRGEARDRTAVAAISAALASERPEGTQAGQAALTAAVIAPYAFSARREPGALLVRGHAPDERSREELLGLVRRRFLSEPIIDEVRVGDGAPPNFARTALLALEQLSRLAVGEIAIRDASLRISGEALYEQVAEQTRQAIAKAAPSGWQVSGEVRARPHGPLVDAEVCQERLTRRLAQNPIRFEGSGPELARDSQGVLDDLAAIAKRCDARIEIAAHGTDRQPLDTSFRRARAVLEHLVKAGVEASRLRAAGYADAPDKASGAEIRVVAKRAGS